MGRPDRRRFQISFPTPLAESLQALAAKPGTTKSSILAAAYTSFLERRGASELDQHFGIRLDHMSRQLARMERKEQVHLESFGLFVRYMMTVTPPPAELDTAARAVARERFAAFVELVGQQLASGRKIFEPEEQQ